MPLFYPNNSVIVQAEDMRTKLASCVVSLFQDSLVPDATTLKAQLEANEATYTGYSTITIATWLGAILNPAGGASIQNPTIQFEATGSATPNMIGGFWIETAGGVVMVIGTFDTPQPMQVADQAIPLDVILRFATGL